MSITFKPGKFNQPEAYVICECSEGHNSNNGGADRDNVHVDCRNENNDANMASQPLSALVDAENAARPDAPRNHPEMDKLIRTIWRLRQADGCPWDREQTHASIAKNMIEEAYEAVDAIEENNPAHICEEFGDVLEQVLLHAQIAADAGDFNIDDVAHALNEKLVRRHPHVFGELATQSEATAKTSPAASTEQEALDRWNEVKRLEREARGEFAHDATPGLLDSVPTSLPALMQAQKISQRAVKAGFEWETTADVWAKVAEERAEFEQEPTGSDAATLEFGDLLFSLVNVARKEGIDAEEALAAANRKFRARWAAMENAAREEGRTIEDYTTAEQNELWNRVKKQG